MVTTVALRIFKTIEKVLSKVIDWLDKRICQSAVAARARERLQIPYTTDRAQKGISLLLLFNLKSETLFAQYWSFATSELQLALEALTFSFFHLKFWFGQKLMCSLPQKVLLMDFKEKKMQKYK
jgi:septum formation topological specificity factor MinE